MSETATVDEAMALNEALGLPHEAGFEDRLARAKRFLALFSGRLKQAKLTEDRAKEIRRRYRAGERVTNLSHEFGVSHSCVYEILRGRAWK